MNILTTHSIRRRLVFQLSIVAALLSVLFAYSVKVIGENTAQITQDQVLASAATSIADAIRSESGELVVDIPYSAFSMLGALSDDRVFYRIDVGGEAVTGYEDLPVELVPESVGQPSFSSTQYRGAEIRIASVIRPLSTLERSVGAVVSVAQTRSGFNEVTSGVRTIATAVGIAFFATAVVLVLLAAQSAIRPLQDVSTAVERRGPRDLRPVNEKVPSEIAPLVTALNRLMVRFSKALDRSEDFIAEAAHRIRTPMALVQTNAEIALRTTKSTQSRRAIREIIEAAEETSRSARQILDHATVGFRTDHLQRQEVPVTALIEAVLDRLLPVAEMKGIGISFQGPAENLICAGDPVLLESALGNVLDNAIKYSPHDTCVTVSAESDGDWIRISVEDEGTGFPVAEIEGLADRFTRGSNAEGTIGSGLGLTIVSDVLVAHAGQLEIENSKEGEGACVSIILPTS
ncbi:sensor histidine kinase [Ruegeria halocynthiae]|uniref:sensor histidine kinase n=1 Tax=Ruegeria halocynthiae TaxID=985054 RepID=UPI00055AB8ED|nr:sensor histidine kinase [Ruegeria halocynthiae]